MRGKTPNDQRGSALVFTVILLTVIIGFAAMAIDVGYWYVVKAELAKSVDAAALAASRSAGNPKVNNMITAFGLANFPAARLGAKAADLTFSGVQTPSTHTYRVTGTVIPARFFSYWMAPPTLTKSATVKMRNVEIVMVLDRSYSMNGTALSNLKAAATSFVNNYMYSDSVDKLGLISFASAVKIDCPLSVGFYTSKPAPACYLPANWTTKTVNMITAISNLNVGNMPTSTTHVDAARILTNPEDALAQAELQFSDQTGKTADERIDQLVIFFSDGNPTAFTGTFLYKGGPATIKAVATTYLAQCTSTTLSDVLMADPKTGDLIPASTLPVSPTGDGKALPTTNPLPVTGGACDAIYTSYCTPKSPSANYATYTANTRWDAFANTVYGLNAIYSAAGAPTPKPANIVDPILKRAATDLRFLPSYVCAVGEVKAIDNASKIKGPSSTDPYRAIKIYSIGIGTIDQVFLGKIASDQAHYQFVNSANLTAVFNLISQDIDVRLLE